MRRYITWPILLTINVRSVPLSIAYPHNYYVTCPSRADKNRSVARSDTTLRFLANKVLDVINAIFCQKRTRKSHTEIFFQVFLRKDCSEVESGGSNRERVFDLRRHIDHVRFEGGKHREQGKSGPRGRDS